MHKQVSFPVKEGKTGTERTYCLVLAVAALTAIVIQCYWGVRTATGNGVPPDMAVVNVLSYFTILTNLLTAVTLVASVIGRPHWLRSPEAQSAVCSYILVVGFVYEAVLRQLWKPEGLHLAVDTTLHDIVPLGFLLYWLVFVPKGVITYRSVMSWTIYPFVYALYCLFRGLAHGFFPYPFINFQQNGWSRWGVNVLLLVMLFLAIGALLIAFDRALGRRRFRKA